MRVVFRADASMEIGSGHVMRCLALAGALADRGAMCHFICREMPGSMAGLIRQRGFGVSELPVSAQAPSRCDASGPAHASWLGCDWETDAAQTRDALTAIRPDWIVVDHYALDARWQRAVRPWVGRVMVIDDLADRMHDCELLLDQNYYADMATRYDQRIPAGCRLLLGPGYVMLRPEFELARLRGRRRDGSVRRMLVFFGGSDPTNQTARVLEALRQIDCTNLVVDVVIGAANPYRLQLEQVCATLHNVHLHCQVSNMAELIEAADLGVGAGGVAMWERCYLGLPTITVAFADNQVRTTEDVAALGAIRYLGRCNDFSATEYVLALTDMLGSADALRAMSERALGVVQPGAQRIVDAMMEAPAA